MDKKHEFDLLVGFIDFEDDETDTGLSFAIYEDGEYTDSLMLARSSFDVVLDDDEQGVGISYGDMFDNSIRRNLLQEACIRDTVLELTCEAHRFTLDLSKLEPSDIEIIKSQLVKLNFDNRYKLTIDAEKVTQSATIAFCWYQPEEWEKLKRQADDAQDLDDTFKDWKKNANNMIQLIQSAGRKVQKINVKADELDAWCKSQGKPNNTNSRTKYAIEIAQRRSQK